MASARIVAQGRPDRESLQAFRFLAELPEADLEQLEQRSERLAAPAGATLIEEGSSDDRLFLICSGELTVDVNGESRRPLVAGDIVGEIAAAAIGGHGFRRTATVRVDTPAELIAVPADVVRGLAEAHPRLRAYLDSLRSQRLTFDAITRHLTESD